MKENLDSVYERAKANKIGWREEIAIGDRRVESPYPLGCGVYLHRYY